MTKYRMSSSNQQRKSFVQLQRNLTYLLVGSIVLIIFMLIAASIIMPTREERHPSGERARVAVQEATITGPLVQHNIPTATVLLKNTGQSPALATKARLVMTVWTADRFPDWDMPLKLTADIEDVGEIDQGATLPRTVALITPLTDVQGMHLERKDWFIVILGIVSYVDILRNQHETKLCLIWRDTSTQRLSPCEKWNDAD